MEVSFSKEIESLRLGAGQTFHGEGILAITKALLQSGVAYVGGYQGAPVSHLLDVMVQAKPYLDELGVHVEACANEASAAAMLGASIHYPLRGAVTWKSIVGTNVASDALSNLSSPGVKGGALIVVGEDYGEGAWSSRSAPTPMRSSRRMCLLDPRPDLPIMVRMVEEGFRLSEASNMPVHPGAAHPRLPCARQLRGEGQRGAARCRRATLIGRPGALRLHAARASAGDLPRRRSSRVEERMPAARKYIVEHGLNELMPGRHDDLGIIVQGGLYNALIRAPAAAGPGRRLRRSARSRCWCSTSPTRWCPSRSRDFCAGKRAVLVVEEGQPEYIEQEIATHLRRRDIQTRLHGKDVLPMAGEYTVEVIAQGA